MEDVAILYICTGNYAKLFQQFYESAKKNLLPHLSKHYYVWTNENIGEYDEGEVSVLPKEFKPWPASTLQRFCDFLTIKEILLEHKYVYFCNADLNIFQKVGDEILPDDCHPLVGVRHIQYDGKNLLKTQLIQNTEKNVFSHAFIDEAEMPYTYIFGCFNGGKSKEYLVMAETIAEWTLDDSSRGIVPIWHDESYLNAYRIQHPELFKLLPVQYAYPDKCGVDGYDDIKIYKIHKASFFESFDFRDYIDELPRQFLKERWETLMLKNNA